MITQENSAIYATLGNELAPALTTGNYDLTTGWSYGTSPNRIEKLIDGTGTVTPTAATTIVSGTTYKVILDVTITANSFSWTLGGVSGVNISASGVYTEYITASTTGKLIITPVATGLRCVINSISFKALTDTTGDLTVEGDLFVNRIKSFGSLPTNGMFISQSGNIGINKTPAKSYDLNLSSLVVSGLTDLGTTYISTLSTSKVSSYSSNDSNIDIYTQKISNVFIRLGSGNNNAIFTTEWIRFAANVLNKALTIYDYFAASPTADTIGDTRVSNQSGVYTIEYCTVANATKGAGTWVTRLSIDSNGIITSEKELNAGGYAKKVYNSTTQERGDVILVTAGEAISKGDVCVFLIGGTSLKMVKCPTTGASHSMPQGVAYTSAAGDGSTFWLATNGLFQVAPESGVTATVGNVLVTSPNQAGKVIQYSNVPAGDHWDECGHFAQTGSGAGALALAILHFN